MVMLLPLLSGIFYRLDGWGRGDNFLPIWPFNKYAWMRTGGINYTRYAIGFLAWAFTGNWIFAVTYSVAVSIPYGEKHWWMIFGIISWFFIGLIFGAASLSWGNALFCGFLLAIMKFMDTDQAWLEFLFGSLGTFALVFK